MRIVMGDHPTPQPVRLHPALPQSVTITHPDRTLKYLGASDRLGIERGGGAIGHASRSCSSQGS